MNITNVEIVLARKRVTILINCVLYKTFDVKMDVIVTMDLPVNFLMVLVYASPHVHR